MSIIYSTSDHMPVWLISTSPPLIGMCVYCHNITNDTRSPFGYNVINTNMQHSWIKFRFCSRCYDIYRIYRPTSDELNHYIHKKTLKKNCHDSLYINNNVIKPVINIVYDYLYYA